MARNLHHKVLWLACIGFIVCSVSSQNSGKDSKKKNVLMLIMDDTAAILNPYKDHGQVEIKTPKIVTPNIDRLAKKSILFENAYCQYPQCNPSRTSFLTGRSLETTRVYDLTHYWRESTGNFTSIPQYFKEHGYTSVGGGKVFHPGASDNDPISWSEPFYVEPSQAYWSEHTRDFAWLAANDSFIQNVSALRDAEITENAIKSLHKLAEDYKENNQPFFMATGMKLTHIPFVFPERFLDYYPLEDIDLPSNPFTTNGLPIAAWPGPLEREWLRFGDFYKYGYDFSINTTLPDWEIRDIRRAYFASITYVDFLIGNILETLQTLDLDDDTIVLFLSDHGYSLGEHDLWGKLVNYDLATKTPLMIHVPGLTDGDKYRTSKNFVELLDLFPTLVDLTSVPSVPKCPSSSHDIETCYEGTSLVPLLENPNLDNWKKQAYTQTLHHLGNASTPVMGFSITMREYRYTEWYEFDFSANKPIIEKPWGTELYDRIKDPEENQNIADSLSMKQTIKELQLTLHSGWRGFEASDIVNSFPEDQGTAMPKDNKKSSFNWMLSILVPAVLVLLVVMFIVVPIMLMKKKKRKHFSPKGVSYAETDYEPLVDNNPFSL